MQIDDAKAMRALAHPLRIQLFELLAIEGTATATRLGELVDESPANCSFHLRTLARHGYIERVPGATGREKPWRVVDVSQSWSSDQADPGTRAAASVLDEAFLDWEVARIKTAARTPVPERWKGSLHDVGATLWLTPAEAHELGEAIAALIGRYVPRWDDPDTRPAGSQPVRLTTRTYLAPYPAGDEQDAAPAAGSGDPS